MTRESAQPKSVKLSTKLKSKFLGTYYGHPEKDLKLICITGTTGRSEVAHFVHEILKSAEQKSALLDDEAPKSGQIHKFLSRAWKSGADFCVITTPPASLEADAFYGLPVHVAALTDYVPSTLKDVSAEDYEAATNTLFDMNPNIVVLNADDLNYSKFSKFAGKDATLTYGSGLTDTIKIESSQLYPKGTEATLSISGTRFTVATFLAGEPNVSYMAAAAAIASSLRISIEAIADGIANYQPKVA